MGRVLGVVEDLGFPDQPARRGVEGEDVFVGAGVDDQIVVDGDVAVNVHQHDEEELLQVIGVRPAVPDQPARWRPTRGRRWRHPSPG